MKRIIFERSGGFMGRKVSYELDLDDLDPDHAGALIQMLEEADFFNLQEEFLPTVMSDSFVYHLSVRIKRHRHTVKFSDTTIPEALRPLVEDLTDMARKERGKTQEHDQAQNHS